MILNRNIYRLHSKFQPAWLIAALNLLNEAEINYKQARNKRLHVELAIIKLCYLLQAVEMLNNDGVVSKKKLVEAAKPVAFKAIQPIRIKEPEPAIVQNPATVKQAALN